MQFIQLGFTGKSNFMSYVATFALTAASVFGLGMVPYTFALKRSGLPLDKGVSAADAIEALGENYFLALQLFPFVAGLIALAFCARYVHGRPVLTLFTSRRRFDLKRFFLSFAAWGGMMAAMLAINMLISGNTYTWNFNADTFLMLLAISIFLIPLQTTFEEAMFRGFLFQGTGTVFRKGWLTIVFTGCLFALLHGSNPEVEILGPGILVYFLVTGIFLGLLVQLDDGLELAMGFHAVNNIFGALIVTNSWQVFQSDALWMDTSKPSAGWDTVASMAVCFPLLILLFSRIYGWKHWKEKLFGEIGKPAGQEDIS